MHGRIPKTGIAADTARECRTAVMYQSRSTDDARLYFSEKLKDHDVDAIIHD